MDAHRKAIIHGSGQSCWRTPPEMVEALTRTFHFSLDLAADAESAVCSFYLGPGSSLGEDSLAVSWLEAAQTYQEYSTDPLVGFLNPPYSLSEIQAYRASTIDDQNVQRNPLPTKRDPFVRARRIENWAEKAYQESLLGFTTIGVFPYAPQTAWFRQYVMGHTAGIIRDPRCTQVWSGHAALDYWRLPHRVSFLQPDGSPSNNAGVNTCIIHWGPNPGFVGPWVPSGRYWSYR